MGCKASFLRLIGWLLARKATLQTARIWLTTDRRKLCRGSKGLSLVRTNKTMRKLHRLGLHEIRNGRLRLFNTKILERIADYYDRPPRKAALL